MRYLNLVGLVLALGMLMGMATCDKVAGVQTNPDGSRTVVAGGGPIKEIAVPARDATSGTPVGWGLSGLLLLINIYQQFRTKTATAAALSTAMTIEQWLATPEGAPFAEKFKELLARGHVQAGTSVAKFMAALVAKFGHSAA